MMTMSTPTGIKLDYPRGRAIRDIGIYLISNKTNTVSETFIERAMFVLLAVTVS